ncbi:3-isopropylmalate dehydratase large subunit [Sphingorhabdus sp. YGSMI21]|uniref:3-isopropylmalate dehydratase large subunit n=1 Tax=Sphingorhabdus sp. YGSMI21 TaxID=2077182 RepID=UPI000C1E9393|nr:3-isopropylmalate dehydratase large subunit [Sphingorhabdus sp. YGSMI21]ATW05383.1 3-isopropylmalate dehydratase [Sphingorhabdus sp. YGSMI21]
MKQALTLFDKLWRSHVVADLPGGGALIAIDRVFLHERTGAAALNSLAEAGRKVADPSRVFAVTDHIVDTRPGRTDQTLMPGGQAFITETRAAARAAGITLFDVNDPDQGIVHVISPELAIVLPGTTVIAPDSHTCTQGAFGALAWGIGSSEAEHAMATGTLRLSKPKSMRVTFTGKLAAGVTPKDMILTLLAHHGAAGGKGHAVEFAGEAVSALDMEGRMTLCNMATEFSAMSGFIAPDDKTFEYLEGRRYAPEGDQWQQALANWRRLGSDSGAKFDQEIGINADAIGPMVSWGTNPGQTVGIDDSVPADAPAAPLDYIGLAPAQPIRGIPIDAAFIGSCTNSRLSDLRRASALLRGRKIAEGIKAICVPGSTRVKREAEAEGIDRIFTDAGFEWRESGCSMCFYAGGESFAAGSRVISTTNRNFESRQGPNVRTHIASPETVVASALAGMISDPRDLLESELV